MQSNVRYKIEIGNKLACILSDVNFKRSFYAQIVLHIYYLTNTRYQMARICTNKTKRHTCMDITYYFKKLIGTLYNK